MKRDNVMKYLDENVLRPSFVSLSLNTFPPGGRLEIRKK